MGLKSNENLQIAITNVHRILERVLLSKPLDISSVDCLEKVEINYVEDILQKKIRKKEYQGQNFTKSSPFLCPLTMS